MFEDYKDLPRKISNKYIHVINQLRNLFVSKEDINIILYII